MPSDSIPKRKRPDPDSREWKQRANALARAHAPAIYACYHCGWPVAEGYGCESCGSTDPRGHAEQAKERELVELSNG